MSKKRSKIGDMLPGQGWVTLNGSFTLDQLQDIVKKLEENYPKSSLNGDKK